MGVLKGSVRLMGQTVGFLTVFPIKVVVTKKVQILLLAVNYLVYRQGEI